MKYFIPCLFLLTACQSEAELLPHAQFASNLVDLCGQTFEGEVVSDDPEDADWRDKTLTVGPIDCSEVEVKMPLAVGEDRSRVWTIMPASANKEWIKLTHIHTLKDGSPDPVSRYGGRTVNDGTAIRQEFPADEFSKSLFRENGLDASVGNVWALEITPNELLAYELNREGRHFRAEFNLNDPS
ncbi:hypothetical protein [Litorimonas sp.]|uniref:hypothetical protein n=1 Tax=Litorimonas sp. TaxID=1892381 RepID=UPI003A890ACD